MNYLNQGESKNTNQLPYFFRYLFPFFIFYLSFDLKIEISSSYLN